MNDPSTVAIVIAIGVFLGAAGNSMAGRFIDWRRNIGIDRRTKARARKDQIKTLDRRIDGIYERLREIDRPRRKS